MSDNLEIESELPERKQFLMNLPFELYSYVKGRAIEEYTSMSAYIINLIKEDMKRARYDK